MSISSIHLDPSSPAAPATFGGLLSIARAQLGPPGGPWAAHRGCSADAVGAALGYAALVAALAELWSALWRELPETDEVAALGRLLTRADGPPGRLLVARGPEVPHRQGGARAAVRCATDLLATHRNPCGDWRSPDSELLGDLGVVHGAAGVVARLIARVAARRDPLALQLARAGVPQAVARQLVGSPGLDLAARRVARRAPSMSARIAALGVARPTVRPAADPSQQVAARLSRLRTIAWELSAAPTVSITTLTDLATAAGLLNRAAATCGVPVSRPVAWRVVRDRLSDLHTTALRSGLIRADVLALRTLLPLLPADARRALVAPHVAGLPQLARWSATAFANARANDRVLVRAGRLSGAEVSERPDLAAAKLRGWLVDAPSARLSAVRALLADAAAG